jgi:lipopolysaccharide transport system ATP-binding protein
MKALEVTDLSKKYKLGGYGLSTLNDDFKKLFNKQKYEEVLTNNRLKNGKPTAWVWALKNISFNIKEGEIVGIIGKNGAGKSTLLKLLSRITSPSEGQIKINGSMSSLLEVGTGFHPELTGRENIYLNGTILGIKRSEINKKISEIIEFSGIGNFIDTPIKRFSSGMIVRLGFAIAAFLDSKILIIDEVLAVGDQEFQKRCLGKIQSISNSGRTVLFVSHNMGSISSLCSRVLLIENGSLTFDGDTELGIKKYMNQNIEPQNTSEMTFQNQKNQNKDCILTRVFCSRNDTKCIPTFDIKEEITFNLEYLTKKPLNKVHITLTLYRDSIPIFQTYSDSNKFTTHRPHKCGTFNIKFTIPEMILKPGCYYIAFYLGTHTGDSHYDEMFRFTIESNSLDLTNLSFREDRLGCIIPKGFWEEDKYGMYP